MDSKDRLKSFEHDLYYALMAEDKYGTPESYGVVKSLVRSYEKYRISEIVTESMNSEK